ncbi:CHAT domain-containing protein [Cellulomonas edaphi]|uniref:CHAT domain-containing protein n=1 Tax=Cellulomonas edaphi TaxID=3053468 RepID=A0ABT7SAX4_9CELL|nr:CHAT domain-containing protein [Cellulomons edaphi]MDM7832177.1 CHAT domain-containing protein [Cellulomons edaphi]
MSPEHGPAAAGPSALDAVAEQVSRADADNGEGRPERARRRLLAALAALDEIDASDTDPAVVRVRARALTELVKSESETGSRARAAADRLAAMVAAGAGTVWPGLQPAIDGTRGLAALRAGRHADAMSLLTAVIDALDTADPIDGCRALLNRGVLHIERRELGPARQDLAECARRSRRAGFERLLFKAEHNLGYVHFYAGHLPEALAQMEAAGRSLPGPPRPTALRDRSDVLLEAGLVGVADSTLAEAAAMFAAQRLTRDVAECELGRAECALLRGDLEAARRFAASARRRFRRRGDEAWAVRATLLALQADAASFAAAPARGRTRTAWTGLSRRAAVLEQLCAATGRRTWELAASYVRIEADLARGAVREPGALLDALGPVRTDDPLAVRLHGRRIRAMLALAAHEPARAGRYVRAGQRDLETHRARFGSLDLRTAGAVHGTALADLDLQLALDTARPSAVLEAVERVRSVISGSPRVSPPSDPETAELLWDLRRLIDAGRGAPDLPASDPVRIRHMREAQRLKHEILARSWHERGTARGARATRSAEVRRTLEDRSGSVVLDVLEHRGDLLAVRVDASSTVLHSLGPAAGLAEQVRRVHADLEVLANPLVPADLRAVANRSLDRSLARIESQLEPALRAPGELVVVAGGWLGVLPWSLLPARAGLPTVVAPSVHHWMRYAGTAAPQPVRVSVAAGPGLRHAETEAQEIGRLWPQGEVLVGQEATVARMVELLASPGVVHLAAHGRHEPDNPLFSSVRLADGPLFAHELDMGGTVPELVLLSSCEVGRASIRAGGEALGLASVLLRTGVGCVVAAVAPLPDETALRVMTRTHALLRDQVPIAQAVATAVEEHRAQSGALVPLVCFGAPV